MIVIKILTVDDIAPDMLLAFRHHQIITKKWTNVDNQWKLTDASDLREWNTAKRIWITAYLRQQIRRGGSVVVAFDGDTLVGFGCVDGCLEGKSSKYANLTMLFVDDDWKRQGVGKRLFERICICAQELKAEKLFISAIPSFETVAFYYAMGCVDAREIISEYIDTDQDRYLEYSLETLI